MERSPSRAIRIKIGTLAIIEESLPFLERDLGDAVNYILKKGIEALGLPKKKPLPFFIENRNHPRHRKAS